MKIPSLTFGDIRKVLDKNSPVILTGMALVGLGASAWYTYKGTQKATVAIIEAREYTSADGVEFTPDDLTNQAKFLLTYKFYIPAATAVLGTGACMIMATKIGLNRTAALGAALVVAERGNEQYRDKVKELLGENKHIKVSDEVAKDQIAAMPAGSFPPITGGEQWFVDAWSGRKFPSTMERMNRAINEVNRDMNRDGYATLSDFYNSIGLDVIQESDVIGWGVDPGKADRLLDLTYTSVLKDGQAVVSFSFNRNPMPSFQDGHA